MKYTKDTLPKQFKFQYGRCDIIHSVIVSDDTAVLEWVDEGGCAKTDKYRLSAVVDYINWGSWNIVEDMPEPNGTDAEGNPTYFDTTMLRPMMRVETVGKGVWIVVENVQASCSEEMVLVRENRWSHFLTTAEGVFNEEYHSLFVATAVYAAPPFNEDLFDAEATGKLIWKATVKKTQAQLDAELEKASLEANIIARNAAIAVHEQQIENHNLRITEILKGLV